MLMPQARTREIRTVTDSKLHRINIKIKTSSEVRTRHLEDKANQEDVVVTMAMAMIIRTGADPNQDTAMTRYHIPDQDLTARTDLT